MEALGYPVTWPTSCFIDGGCGAAVFAHTNGYGDFVLFDQLGSPWQVHACYTNRFFRAPITGSGLFQVRPDQLQEYRLSQDVRTPAPRKILLRDIKKVSPRSLLSESEFLVVGYVQDYFERQAERVANSMGNFGQQVLHKVLGPRKSQITIVTSELKSFTVFADLRNVVVKRKDSVLARVRAVQTAAIPGIDSLFLATDLTLIRGDARE
jgi:hypothetical protein